MQKPIVIFENETYIATIMPDGSLVINQKRGRIISPIKADQWIEKISNASLYDAGKLCRILFNFEE